MSTSQEEWEKWFQDVWSQREDGVYRELFGTIGPHVHTVPPELFAQLGQPEPDPRWLVHGVFEVAPSDKHTCWTYVTTALSNPWGIDPAHVKPTDPSGLGFELIIQTPVQSPWAIQVLHWLIAVNILCASGKLQGETMFVGGRIPLHTSIDPRQPESLIRNLLVIEPTTVPAQFTLPSGTVDLLLCVGITDNEMQFAGDNDYQATIDHLEGAGMLPLTDPARPDTLT